MKDPTVKTVTKRELLEAVGARTSIRRADLAQAVEAFLEQVITELRAGRRIELRDFGVFEVRTRRARVARNPRTKEEVPVESRAVVKFKAGREMRTQVLAAGQATLSADPKGKAKRAKPASKVIIEPKPQGVIAAQPGGAALAGSPRGRAKPRA
jgi:integration host factor subunit beta